MNRMIQNTAKERVEGKCQTMKSCFNSIRKKTIKIIAINEQLGENIDKMTQYRIGHKKTSNILRDKKSKIQ